MLAAQTFDHSTKLFGLFQQLQKTQEEIQSLWQGGFREDHTTQTKFEFSEASEKIVSPIDDPDYSIEFCSCSDHH